MYNKFKFLIFNFFIIAGIVSGVSAADLLKVNDKTQKVDISLYSEIFIDAQNHFSYEDVRTNLFSENFKPLNLHSLSEYNVNDTIWMRFNISNVDENPFFGKIEMPISWINNIKTYVVADDETDEKNPVSTLLSEKKEITGRSFFLPLTIEPFQTLTVYIKAKNANSISFTLWLYSDENAAERLTYITMLNGSLIGIVLIMLFYNIHIFFILKNKSYLYFALYLASLFFLINTYYGSNLQLLWSYDAPLNENTFYPIIAFNFFAGLLFTRNFLNTNREFPKADKLLLFLMGSSVAFGVFAFMLGNNFTVIYVALFLTIIYFLFLLFLSLFSLKKKIAGSVYLLLGWLFLAVGQIMASMMILGFIDYSDFIYDMYGIVVILNTLMLSFAFISNIKYKEMQYEYKIKKNHEITSRLNVSKKELRELNEKLKNKIERQEKVLLEKSNNNEKYLIKDEITMLYNKTKLEEVLTQELHRKKRYNSEFSIAVINIDNMKSINDKYDYQVGNSVMKEMADLFIHNIRYLDTVGRWSEKEYLIIYPETKGDQAYLAAQKLHKLVEEAKFFFVGKVTASFGVANSHRDDTLQDIMKRAYEALEKAQEEGGNRVEIV
jgi:diguanylate cyclase (GGDEF)-like protein